MPPSQSAIQPSEPNDTDNLSTIQKRSGLSRTLKVVAIVVGAFFLLPVVLFTIIFIVAFFAGRTPNINVPDETKNIQSYLNQKYGKDFEVKDIKGHGAQALGDKPSITAKAYPVDDSELEVMISKKLELGGQYTDTYLHAYWSKENRQILEPKLQEIFGKISAFSNSVAPPYSYSQRSMGGRVIPLAEVYSKYSDEINYGVKVELGLVDDSVTQEIISERLYQLILYMRQQIRGEDSHVELTYETQEASYSCNLRSFKYDFVESARQLEGCWTEKLKVTLSSPKQRTGKILTLGGPSLPVTFSSSSASLTEAQSVMGASATYSLNEGSQLLAMVSVYQTGYDEKINKEKQNFPINWLKGNILVPVGANSTLLTNPDEGGMVGSMAYRADNGPNTRVVHYAIAYKAYLIHIEAKTLEEGIDIRDREFNLKYIIDSIKPLDGFNSIH